jgi:hypothetical protein
MILLKYLYTDHPESQPRVISLCNPRGGIKYTTVINVILLMIT